MTGAQVSRCLMCCCLLLALSGCGNKGPLVLPEEEEQKEREAS